jgi:hypothetical protein
VCRGCVVRDECPEYALVNGESSGSGGMSDRERRRTRPARPPGPAAAHRLTVPAGRTHAPRRPPEPATRLQAPVRQVELSRGLGTASSTAAGPTHQLGPADAPGPPRVVGAGTEPQRVDEVHRHLHRVRRAEGRRRRPPGGFGPRRRAGARCRRRAEAGPDRGRPASGARAGPGHRTVRRPARPDDGGRAPCRTATRQEDGTGSSAGVSPGVVASMVDKGTTSTAPSLGRRGRGAAGRRAGGAATRRGASPQGRQGRPGCGARRWVRRPRPPRRATRRPGARPLRLTRTTARRQTLACRGAASHDAQACRAREGRATRCERCGRRGALEDPRLPSRSAPTQWSIGAERVLEARLHREVAQIRRATQPTPSLGQKNDVGGPHGHAKGSALNHPACFLGVGARPMDPWSIRRVKPTPKRAATPVALWQGRPHHHEGRSDSRRDRSGRRGT